MRDDPYLLSEMGCGGSTAVQETTQPPAPREPHQQPARESQPAPPPQDNQQELLQQQQYQQQQQQQLLLKQQQHQPSQRPSHSDSAYPSDQGELAAPPPQASINEGLPLTFKLIREHNQNTPGSFWLHFRGQVYDVRRIFNEFRQLRDTMPCVDSLIGSLGNSSLEAKLMYYSEVQSLIPPPGGKRRGEDDEMVEVPGEPHVVAVVTQHRAGALVVMSRDELVEWYRADMQWYVTAYVRETQQYGGEIYQPLVTGIERHMATLPAKLGPPPAGNPNEHTFRLPPGVDPAQLEEHRGFAMDTEFVNGHGPLDGYQEREPWAWGKLDADEVHTRFTDLIKRDRDDGDEFDTGVPEGEVAWEVIEVDLFQNDVTLPSQDVIWKARASRDDLDDKDKMAERRAQLSAVCVERYKFREDKMAPYVSWADNMEASWAVFQELVDKE